MKKKCIKCKKLKAKDSFYFTSQTKKHVRGSCKDCDISSRRERLAKAPPEQRRSVVLKNKYGITHDDFTIMLLAQNNCCKICKSSDPGVRGIFKVDHCHTTGKVRGLLCQSCNVGIGLFGDDTTILKNAIQYLENSRG